MGKKQLKIAIVLAGLISTAVVLGVPNIKSCSELAGSDWQGSIHTPNGYGFVDVQINGVTATGPSQAVTGSIRLLLGSEDNSYKIDPRVSSCQMITQANNINSITLSIRTIDDYITVTSEGNISTPLDNIPVAVEAHLPRSGVNSIMSDTTLRKTN